MKTLANAVLAFTLIASAQALAAAERPAAVPPGLRFIPIPPCRLLDTAVNSPATKAEESLRHVDLDDSRCGSLLPQYALHYSLQVTTYSVQAPETLPAGTAPARRATTLPAAASRKLDFDVPAGYHIAVDVDGYYVAPGTPIFPFDPPANSTGATSVTNGPRLQSTSQPRALSLHDGTTGDIYLNAAAPFTSTGVRLDVTQSPAGAQHIVSRLGDPASSSGFWIYDSTTAPSQSNAIMNVMSNGHVTILNTPIVGVRSRGSYLDAQTAYQQGPSVQNNVVHDVSITNPLDGNASSVTRVTFFNAASVDEVGSPATTKFRAFTRGYYAQNNINFDSQVMYHWAGAPFYHFRALSTYDPGGAGKETFWVKAATSGDSLTNTRADMYVSGLVGIGTATPKTSLHILGAFDNSPNNAALDANKGLTITSSAVGSSMYALGNQFGIVFAASNTSTTSNYPVSGIMAIPDTVNSAVGGSLVLQTHTMNDATLLERMRITSDGKIGIGLTNPSQQLSVAGTIQTSAGVLFPDGLQTAPYPFTAGTNTADLNRNVAGPLTSSVTNPSSSGSANLAAMAGSGNAYVRLASSEPTPTRDWRVGMTDSSGIFKIRDNVANVDRMTITGSAIHFNGDVDGTTVHATYQDLAEWVPAAERLPSGTVVVIGEDASNTVTASTHAYDTSVAGVVSPNPGLLLGVASDSKAKIATTGRVRVRVDATKSPIHKGDLLGTSDRPGMAMKSEPLDIGGVKIHRPGTLIGKALEPLATGEGEILVLLSLQ